jgi:hypothetical protein
MLELNKVTFHHPHVASTLTCTCQLICLGCTMGHHAAISVVYETHPWPTILRGHSLGITPTT